MELGTQRAAKGYTMTSGNHAKCDACSPDNHVILHIGKSLLTEEATW